ncbi:MAG: putative sulfate exporter family transporter, partial [Burkholderiaceae bacterium]
LFGGTIHDVAQVVGAALVHGGEGSAEMASYVKLLRVAMLAPVVLGVGIFITSRASQADQAGAKSTLIPLFLVGFFGLFALVNVFSIPKELIDVGSTASRTLILLAVAGLGVKTSLRELAALGWRPMLMLVANTLFLLLVVLLLIWVERGLFVA